MGGRHEARQWAVQFLFQRDFNRDDLDPALELFWAGVKGAASTRRFAEDLIRGVDANREELDRRIQQYAEHWDLKRMGAVDRNVMRVALYEMLHCPDVPPVVSINEAIELAKELSGAESGKFVNGILDRARQDIDRPARSVKNSAMRKKEKASRGHMD